LHILNYFEAFTYEISFFWTYNRGLFLQFCVFALQKSKAPTLHDNLIANTHDLFFLQNYRVGWSVPYMCRVVVSLPWNAYDEDTKIGMKAWIDSLRCIDRYNFILRHVDMYKRNMTSFNMVLVLWIKASWQHLI
jgi:hypothetical protein